MKYKNIQKNNSDFVSINSVGILHDVINPLSGLILYLENLQKNKNKRIFIDDINPLIKSNKKMIDFIRKIQLKFLKNTNSSININSIIFDCIKILQTKAKLNNVSITFTRNKVSRINTIELNLYRVFINLISNSIDSFNFKDSKTNQKNSIKIIVEEFGKYLVIKVTDNGCGISKDNLEKIFLSSFTTKKKGSGVGLFYTKEIIEKELKGQILVKSQPNIGTTFKLILRI